MSGPIPSAVAKAAHLHALRAEAGARGVSIGRLIGLRQREAQIAKAGSADTPGGREWRGYSSQARTLLVTHAAQDYSGDPRAAAMQPWGSFSDRDRAQMGAMARELAREFKDAACLF